LVQRYSPFFMVCTCPTPLFVLSSLLHDIGEVMGSRRSWPRNKLALAYERFVRRLPSLNLSLRKTVFLVLLLGYCSVCSCGGIYSVDNGATLEALFLKHEALSSVLTPADRAPCYPGPDQLIESQWRIGEVDVDEIGTQLLYTTRQAERPIGSRLYVRRGIREEVWYPALGVRCKGTGYLEGREVDVVCFATYRVRIENGTHGLTFVEGLECRMADLVVMRVGILSVYARSFVYTNYIRDVAADSGCAKLDIEHETAVQIIVLSVSISSFEPSILASPERVPPPVEKYSYRVWFSAVSRTSQ